jgi:transposase
LRDREADVLRFLSDLQIPPTSNQAERDLRPAKTQQKIPGRLRSEKAARDRYAIRGFQRSPDPALRESRNAMSNSTAEAA